MKNSVLSTTSAVSQPSNLFYWPADKSLTEYLPSLIFSTKSRSFG